MFESGCNTKECVFMSEAQRNNSRQKYGSFEGGTPGGLL